MRYVEALCEQFVALAHAFKTEHITALEKHINARDEIKKSGLFYFNIFGVSNAPLSHEARTLMKCFQSTQKAHEMVLMSLRAHMMEGSKTKILTDILSRMSNHDHFDDPEVIITGRRAYETLSNPDRVFYD